MKNKKYIFFFFILIMIIAIIIAFKYYMGGFLYDGGTTIKDFKERKNYSHILYETTNNETNLQFYILHTFDEKNICVSTRLGYEFIDEASAKQEYTRLLNLTDIKNVSLNQNIVSYNVTLKLGETKESILFSFSPEDNIKEY